MSKTDKERQKKGARKEERGTYKSLLEHLTELRKVLIISLVALSAAFIIVFITCSPQLISFLTTPLKERGIEIIYTSLSESLTIQVKVSFIAGGVIAAPIILAQVWKFIGPALYPNERFTLSNLFLIAIILFVAGILFAYYVVFNMAVQFFLVTGENLATPMMSLDKYVSFLFSFILPFGVMFEMPVVSVILSRLGFITAAAMARSRKYVILIIFVVAAVLTPPDVVSQVLMALPLVALFEISVLICRIIEKKRRQSIKVSG